MMIRFVIPFDARRRRVRRVDELHVAQEAAETAKKEDRWVVLADHGGSVANSYGYPALTECVLAVSDPHGAVALWAGQARANKVTERGAAAACVTCAGDLFDNRCGQQRKDEALDGLKRIHGEVFSVMEIIAIAAKE